MMTSRFYFSLCLMLFLPIYAVGHDLDFQRAIHQGAMAQISVRVVDDEQKPVSGVTVESRFDAALRSRGCVVTVTTDTNGMAIVTGKTGKSLAIQSEASFMCKCARRRYGAPNPIIPRISQSAARSLRFCVPALERLRPMPITQESNGHWSGIQWALVRNPMGIEFTSNGH